MQKEAAMPSLHINKTFSLVFSLLDGWVNSDWSVLVNIYLPPLAVTSYMRSQYLVNHGYLLSTH